MKEWPNRLRIQTVELIVVAVVIGATAALAGTVSFQNGVNGYEGTVQIRITSGLLSYETGGSINDPDFVMCRKQVPGQIEGSMDFWLFDDLFGTAPGQIPPNSTILSARLELRTCSCQTGPAPQHGTDVMSPGPMCLARMLDPNVAPPDVNRLTPEHLTLTRQWGVCGSPPNWCPVTSISPPPALPLLWRWYDERKNDTTIPGPDFIHGDFDRPVGGFIDMTVCDRVESADVTDLFSASELSFLRREEWEKWARDGERRPGFELGAGPFCVRAVRLKGLAGTLTWPAQPDHAFSAELAGRIRVIAGLDQRPILLHGEKWPDYRGSLQELRRVRSRLRCGPDDAVVVVWGPLEDTLTAADEIRLRYVDAIHGIPNETRQPFRDGSTDFERILPGPDRMYPDTDSPPTSVTRERVARLAAGLAERPWQREARYSAAGVPKPTIHYLHRRGGAAIVDRLVAEAGADLRRACFLFGERLVYLRRAGAETSGIPFERWAELFRRGAASPVLWQAWEAIVRAMAADPGRSVAEIVSGMSLGEAPPGWPGKIPDILDSARLVSTSDDPGRILRVGMTRAMSLLRGKVPATEVEAALRSAMGETK